MGGYCKDHTRVGQWVFTLPQLDSGSTVLFWQLEGRRTGAGFSGQGWVKIAVLRGNYTVSTAVSSWYSAGWSDDVWWPFTAEFGLTVDPRR